MSDTRGNTVNDAVELLAAEKPPQRYHEHRRFEGEHGKPTDEYCTCGARFENHYNGRCPL